MSKHPWTEETMSECPKHAWCLPEKCLDCDTRNDAEEPLDTPACCHSIAHITGLTPEEVEPVGSCGCVQAKKERDKLRAENIMHVQELERYRVRGLPYRDFYYQYKDVVAERDKLLTLISDVCLDHSCGLEGWDEACAECNLMKHLRADA